MKMVKSLLLVSAAGIVASAGAQAADLPVKAKPVEYVKVCSLYGAGFYYIPGTDICMKIGGYIRYQVNSGSGNSVTGGPFAAAPGGYNNRAGASDVLQRARAIATFDTRQQTAYGTLRTYLLIGYSQETSSATTTAPNAYSTRAFIQIAGFTFGKATSFFDFVSTAAVAINAGFTSAPDTGDGGHIVGGYTAQFGNGVSGTIAIEQSRRLGTVYGSASFLGQPGTVAGGVPGIGNGAYTWAGAPLSENLGAGAGVANPGSASRPDFVANLRIDQAWGSAQIAGAVHDVSASYYGLPNGQGQAPIFTSNNGHPGDKWGWAVSPGLRLNAPMIGPGDYFQASATYAVGANRYVSNTPGGGNLFKFSGNTVGFGFSEDGVFTGGPGNSIQLTTSYGGFASYEHFWTPSLRTSLYGSIYHVDHSTAANNIICSTGTAPGASQVAVVTGGGVGLPQSGAVNYQNGCNADFTYWNVGSRSQWNVTKDFYLAVDVIYTKLQTATFNSTGAAVNLVAPGGASSGLPSGQYTAKDQDAVSVSWRAHRDIVP